jgi:hypothetical protein
LPYGESPTKVIRDDCSRDAASTIGMSLDGYGRGIPAAKRAANTQLVNALLQ